MLPDKKAKERRVGKGACGFRGKKGGSFFVANRVSARECGCHGDGRRGKNSRGTGVEDE